MTIDFEPDAEASLPGIDFEPDAPDAVKPASKPKAPSADPIAAIKAAQGLAQMHDFEASGFPSRLAFENDKSSRLSRMRKFSRVQKQSGLSSEDLRTGMADAAALNFNRRFDNEGKPMRDDARVLSFGEVAANPQLSFDEGAWKSAIESTNASPEAKQRAIADRLKYRDDLGEHLYQAALSSGTFKDWLDAQKDSEKASAGELIERFRKEKGAVSKGFMQAGSGIEAGVAGLGKGFYGLGEFMGVSDLSDAIGITDPKNPSLATIAAENEKRASGIAEALGGATFLNKVSRGSISLTPMILAGGTASTLGASEAGALNAGIAAQAGITSGGTFVDAKRAGLGPIESRLHGAYQAGVEAAFTKLGGATGAEALLSRQAGASGAKNFAKNFVKGAARETFLEELPTTALQAPSAARIDPNYNLADALTDTATVSVVLGGAMEGASGVSRANAAKALIAQAQEVGLATQAAVDAMRPRRAPEQNAAVAKPIVSESTKLRLTPKPEEQIYAPTNRDIQPSQTPSIPPTESVPSLPQAKEPVRLPSAESGLESAGEIDFEADVFEGVKPKPTKPEPYVEVYMPPINQFEIDSPADTFGDEGTLAGAVMDLGGIMSKSNGIKYGKVMSQWNDQFTPAKLSHRKVFGAGKAAKGKALVENTDKRFLAGLPPSEMVDQLIDANRLPEGSTVNDLWAALQEESDSAARVQGQASAEVRNVKDSIREARKRAVDFKDAAMQKDGDPIRIRELSINDTIKIADEPLKVIAIDPDTGDVTLEDGKRFGIQEVSERSIVYGEIVETADASVDDIWADENETTPQQQGDDTVQAGKTPEAAAETGAQAEGAAPIEVAPAVEPDRSHLNALEDSLIRERGRLSEAKTEKERAFRQAQIDSKIREIASERKFLGLPEEVEMSDSDLLRELGVESEPAPAVEVAPAPEQKTIPEQRAERLQALRKWLPKKRIESVDIQNETFEFTTKDGSVINGRHGDDAVWVRDKRDPDAGEVFWVNANKPGEGLELAIAAIDFLKYAGKTKIVFTGIGTPEGRGLVEGLQKLKLIGEQIDKFDSDTRVFSLATGKPAQPAPAEAPKAPVPKLRAGQTQGDLLAGTTEDAFNLAGETAIDGERVAREKAEKEKREAELQADFEKRQMELPVQPAKPADAQKPKEQKKPEEMTTSEWIGEQRSIDAAELAKTRSLPRAEQPPGVWMKSEAEKMVMNGLHDSPAEALNLNRERLKMAAVAIAKSAIKNGDAFNAEYVDSFGIEIPDGYTLQGNVYRKQPAPDVAPSGLPIGPGKMTAGELPEQTKIGSYNAMVDKQRAERGLPPLMSEARKLDETTWDNAERAIEADETLPERLVDDILSGRKMQATDEEQAVLLWRMIDLRNRREQAGIRMNDSSLSIDEQNAQMNEFSFLEAQLQEAESADRKIGTAQGRALRFRRVLANEDFTLAGIEAGLRRAKSEPLTPDELAGAKEDADKIAGIQKMADQKEDAADEQQSIEAAKALIAEAARYSPEVLRYAEKVVSKWEAEAAAAEQVLREAMGFANAGVNPKVIGAIFKIARAKLARKALSLADFTAEMVSKFGDGITAAVEPAYERAVKFITGLDASKVRKKSKKQLDRESAAGDQADATEAGIREVASKGTKFSELSAEVKRLAREYIESGVDTVEKLEDRLYAFFNPLFPEITKRQLRDAFSDYGKSTPAPTDPLRVTASRLRTEAQKLSQLESLMAKQAPLRTGQQRNPQSDRARALQREINELKRRMELTEGRTADQLRTILDSMITRTTNRIKDLRFEIARGERLIRTKTAPPTSMKLEALREELAKVEAEHASMFPRAQMTEEQKLKVAIAAAERANKVASAELENAKKGIFSKPAEKGVTRSAELEAIRQKTKAARLELAALKDAANPRNPELEAAQDALNKALVSKERWDQVLKGELVVPGKKPGEALSDFEDDVRAEIAAMRQLAAEIKRDSRPKTDPQIAKENAQVKALEKAAADYEARLNAGDFSKKGRVNGPDTERVAAAKALRDAAKKAYDAAVEAATPKLSPEQIKINVRKAQIQRQLAEIADREARGDYAKRAKKPKLDLSSDPEAVKLQAQLEKAKSDLARKMFEYEQARRTRGQKIKDAIFETLRSERNILGSSDISAPRQGLGIILAHPVIGAKKLTKMFSALFSEKQALEMEAARNLRPNAQAGIYKKMKLALTPLGETTFTAAEENARSSVEKWANFDLGKGNLLVRAAKAPLKIIGKVVRISNRAYVTYLNELRADVADALLRINFHSAAPSDADLEAVGSMINTFSGRGLERGAGQFASNILYSPQFLMARIKMLIGFHAWRPNSTADARKIAAKEHVRQLATWFVITSLINALSDEKDEKDEGLASSDTGKFVDGNTRIDYSGGSASLFVLGARLWNNVAASVSRNFSDDDKGAKKQAWDFPQEFYRQYRYKAAPWIGTILDWASGKPPLSSEPVTVADSARRLVMPMSWDGVSGLMEEHGIAKGAFYQMQNLLGAGVKNYESKR